MKLIVKDIRENIEITINKSFNITIHKNQILFDIKSDRYIIYAFVMYHRLFKNNAFNKIIYSYQKLYSNYKIFKDKFISTYIYKQYQTSCDIKINSKYYSIYLIFVLNKFNNCKLLKKQYEDNYNYIRLNLYDIKFLNTNDLYKSTTYII